MLYLLTPYLSRLFALLFSAAVGLLIGLGSTPMTGIIVFSVILLWFFSGLLGKNFPYTIPFLRNLKTFSGTASDIRHSTDTQGSEDSIRTYQVAAFNLDNIPVQLKMSDSIFISEGDELVISGLYRRGILSGLAYKNRTRNNLIQRAPAGAYLLFGIFLGFFGLAAFTAQENLNAIGWLLCLASIGVFRIGTSIYRAAGEVRHF